MHLTKEFSLLLHRFKSQMIAKTFVVGVVIVGITDPDRVCNYQALQAEIEQKMSNDEERGYGVSISAKEFS